MFLKLVVAAAILFGSLFSSMPAYAGPVWYPLPKEAYQFGTLYPEAQNLLFAFDYGHALVYEKLLLNKGNIEDPEAFEQELLREIFAILKNPPTIKVDEDDIAPNYVYTFPLMVDIFDWSHLLHQFVLDVLATSKDRDKGMWKRVDEIYQQYQSHSSIAITDRCKTMKFMDGHYFSKAFRRQFPSFNLLIWSYHWFQIKLYEALLAPTRMKRDQNVQDVLDQFWQLIAQLPDSAEFDMMPSVFTDAPEFSKVRPDIAASFDNNHMLHDIVSDILTSPRVERHEMRRVGVDYALMVMDPAAFAALRCGEN